MGFADSVHVIKDKSTLSTQFGPLPFFPEDGVPFCWKNCAFVFRRVLIVAKSTCEVRHVRIFARISAAPTGRISVKFDIEDFHEDLEKFQV